MNPDQLKRLIESNFRTQKEFVRAFNSWSGSEYLKQPKLSKQLKGAVGISIGWQAAYSGFFNQLSK